MRGEGWVPFVERVGVVNGVLPIYDLRGLPFVEWDRGGQGCSHSFLELTLV